MKLNVLIGCEESQEVCKAFRELGHDAFSCDLQDCSGGHPEWHIKGDIFQAANSDFWDLFIGHPPCTFLAVSGAQWYYHPDDKHLPTAERRPHPKYPTRWEDRKEAVLFFKRLCSLDIPHSAIENPVGIMSTEYRKPDQIIQPFQFGDEATKTTCLWLYGLPLLQHTEIVGKGEKVFFASGKSQPKWYADALKAPTKQERQKLRSKTFPGIAAAFASQWSNFHMSEIRERQQELAI